MGEVVEGKREMGMMYDRTELGRINMERGRVGRVLKGVKAMGRVQGLPGARSVCTCFMRFHCIGLGTTPKGGGPCCTVLSSVVRPVGLRMMKRGGR